MTRPDDERPEGGAGMDRRTALKVIVASAAGSAAACSPDAGTVGSGSAHEALSGFAPLPPSNPNAAGTAADPDLLAPVVSWEGVLTEREMEVVTALCDLVIPADDRSPSASQVGVPAYVNEHVSAPYPRHRSDRVVIQGGLAWLNREGQARFGMPFPRLSTDQQREICDPVRSVVGAPEGLEAQARFFDLFRDIASTAFWTTDEGMRDLGYMGNVPLPTFDGPPREVLDALGLEPSDLL